ncbi:uncharacterized protein TRIADDRAFT_61848 [Trichoplax adhaerens]|uniref:G-protein coupled receptors family 2 profile 2 domain-containing protein n=1 Tax=Trichoplax adhaerens TaxID=10228 RepID=B3SC58_TRIAD|nr:hypothetical protein TRIADDRAFT_61848 [Trichoplax adhaerens]EDV19661.1 hypothetical protein TRIADDRAFT_61848 [Trichoplax adhaerens]|eukprot:XP_002117818.1 hypothetical protein TRIADDRAFT_61848 [Trichoplax adhaerens]
MPKDSVILYELLPSLLSEISVVALIMVQDQSRSCFHIASDEQLDIISQPQVSSRKFIITSWLEHSQIDIKESMLSMNDVIMNEVKIFTSPDISVSNQSLQDLAAESIHLQKDATISPELRTQEPMFSLKSSLDLTNQLDLSEVSLVSNIDSVAIFSEADGVDVITISSELTVQEPPMNFPKSSLNLADKPDLSVLEVSNIYSMTIFSEINKVEENLRLCQIDHEDLSSVTVDADARLILTEIIQLQNPTADLQSELGDIQSQSWPLLTDLSCDLDIDKRVYWSDILQMQPSSSSCIISILESSMDSAGDVCDQANNCPEYYTTLPSQQEPDCSTINPLKSPIKNSISNLSSRTLYDTTLDMTYRTPTPSSTTKYITQRKNTGHATSTFNGSQANQILASFNQNISKTTVNTAKVLGYSRTLHEIIDKIDMKSLSTAETTDLSEFVVKIVKKLVTAGINGSNQDKIASDYMQLLDHYFLRVAEKLSYGETFNFTDVETGDVTMVISVQQVEAYNSTNYEFVFNSKSALRKSDDVLINLSNIMFRKNETVKIIAGIYWFLQDTVARVNDQLTLSSDIISCKIEPYPVFQDNAIFQYHVSYPNKASKNSGNNWKCMYWDLQSRSWNNTGCTTNLNLNKVVCVCNHLTHFALLLQIKNVQAFFSLYRINSERFVIHKNLLVALMFSQICIITASQATKFEVLCKVMAIISHFFCLASFSWMLVEAAHLYFLIISVFNHRSKMILYFIFGWGIPIIVVGVTVAVQHENYGRDQICWLSTKNGFTWAFIGPVVAIIAINFVVMIAVVKIAVASSTKNIFANHGIKNKLRGIKTMVKAISILCPILGLTWLIGLIPITQETIAVAYVFVILNSSQGISIFIFHCLYNSEINSNVISSPKFSTSSNKIAKLKDDLNLSYKIIPLARAITKPINEQEEGRLNCAY